jgi:hypothetical protein
MRVAIVVILGWLFAAPAHAQEPVGCDKFKWPLDQERSLLTSGKAAAVASGSSVTSQIPVAVTVNLAPFADAKLAVTPERAPRLPTSFAGFIQVAAPTHDGTYKISLSSEAWIDVVQAGHSLKSVAFSGATGCEGIRKSVKFDLKAEPFAVQLTNVPNNSIGVAISGD